MFGALINGGAICFCKAITAQSRVAGVRAPPRWHSSARILELSVLSPEMRAQTIILGQWPLNLVAGVEGVMVKMIWPSPRRRTGQQMHITLIPFGCPPAPAPNAPLPRSDAALPVPAGFDYSRAHAGKRQDSASDSLFPRLYGGESKQNQQ